MPRPHSSRRYWRINIRLIAAGLLLGFIATFGVAFYARELDSIQPGWRLGFWLTAQGALLLYLLIVTAYAWIMNRLDDRQSGSSESPPT